jgi:hypothetical protein
MTGPLPHPFLKNKGLPLSGSDGELQYHEDYVNYGKTDGSDSHSHMPFEGDIVETLQHENTQQGSRQETDERDNSQKECKGKTKDHDMAEGSNHTINDTVPGCSYNYRYFSIYLAGCFHACKQKGIPAHGRRADPGTDR